MTKDNSVTRFDKLIEDVKEVDDDFDPYCPKCGGCGYIGCCGIKAFLDAHVKGKTDCTEEEGFISEIVSYADDEGKHTIEVLEEILKHGHGGGNFRRLIMTALDKEKEFDNLIAAEIAKYD